MDTSVSASGKRDLYGFIVAVMILFPVSFTSLAPAAEIGSVSGKIGITFSGGAGSGGTYGTQAENGDIMPDLFTGTMAHSIPIKVPEGRKGMEPRLALMYRSINGNGWIGVGWDLEVGAIERSIKNNINYTGDEYLLRMTGASVDLTNIGNNEYRAKIESGFNRIKKLTASDGRIYWEVTDKSGVRYFYGQASSSRQDNPADANQIFKWCLDRVEDTNGNYIVLSYTKDQGQIYLDRIDYTGHNSGIAPTNYVKFHLAGRTDAPDMYTVDFKVKTAFRLKAIEIRANGILARAYKLTYATSGSTSRSLLASVQQFGKDATVDINGPLTGENVLPASSMIYSSDLNGFEAAEPWTTMGDGNPARYIPADVNGDGKADMLFLRSDTGLRVALSTGTGFDLMPTWMKLGGNGDPARYRFADFDGDGKIDVVRVAGTAELQVALSIGSSFTPPTTWAIMTDNNPARYSFVDFNADGKADVIYIGGTGSLQIALSTGSSFTTSSSWGLMGTGNPTQYISSDVNGDGKADLVFIRSDAGLQIAQSTGSGFDVMPTPTTVGDGNPTRYLFSDVNGDGKSDIVYIRSDAGLQIALSMGSGFDVMPTRTTVGDGIPARYKVHDFNGDGKTDVLFVDSNGNVVVGLSTGYSFTVLKTWVTMGGGDPTRYFSADFNGDSKADALLVSSVADLKVATAKGQVGDLCSKISNGMGSTSTITYTPSPYYDSTLLSFFRQTVRSVSANDGKGNVSTTAYEYSGGFYHSSERDFRGFNYVKMTGPVGPNGEQTINETWFHQGNDTAVDVNDPQVSAGCMKGKPYRSRVTDGQGRVYSESTMAYADDADNAAPYFNPLSEVKASVCDGDGVCGQQTKTVFTYDGYGNVTREDNYGDVNDPSDDRTFIKSYSPNTTAWILGRPLNETIFQGTYPGIDAANLDVAKKVAATDLYYDGVSDCNSVSMNQTPIKGNVTRIVRWLNGGTSPEARMAYDAYGNPICTRDAKGNVSTMAYDSSFTFSTVATTPPVISNSAGLKSVAQYYGVDNVTADNGLCGQVKSVTDPNSTDISKVETVTEYDVFGRKKKVTEPDRSTTSWDYNGFGWLDNTPDSQHVYSITSGFVSSWTYFDGLGRTTASKSRSGPKGRVIAVSTEYNGNGTVKRKSMPYFDGTETPRWKTFTYDPLGRVIRVDNPDGTKVLNCYNDGVTATIDANGHKKQETLNAHGKLVKVEEYLGQYTACVIDPDDIPYATTTYQYDVLGNLVKIIDAENNETVLQYDTLGRRRFMKDPDVGELIYEYDANGNLISQVDANQRAKNGQPVRFEYDQLNRIMKKDYPTGTDVVYTYDVNPGNIFGTGYPVGRLSKMTDASGTTEYYYDIRGRQSALTKKVDNVVYTTRTTYDLAGRVQGIGYPGIGGIVTYTYDDDGNLWKVTEGTTKYAEYTGYNALGQPATITYGNNVSTSYQYNPSNNRLAAITTSKPATETQPAQQLLRLAYAYDNAGNIASITDNINSTRTQNFIYDDINRLIQAQSAAYGPLFYVYNQIGNITHKEGVNYAYSNSGAGPHAVTSTSDGKTYSYDPNGNMISDGQRTIAYNYDNLPESITLNNVTTSFVYDGAGARVKKISPSGTTVYISNLYECNANACSKYILAGDKRIALKTGNSILYYHHDHLGSTSVVTAADGSKQEDIYYYPFGGTKDDTGGVSVTHKYTGQELDAETGLYYYGARYYNATVGRFISPDSLVPDIAQPQSLNGYSYVFNNPIYFADPTGNYPEYAYGAYMEAALIAALQNNNNISYNLDLDGYSSAYYSSYVYLSNYYNSYAYADTWISMTPSAYDMFGGINQSMDYNSIMDFGISVLSLRMYFDEESGPIMYTDMTLGTTTFDSGIFGEVAITVESRNNVFSHAKFGANDPFDTLNNLMSPGVQLVPSIDPKESFGPPRTYIAVGDYPRNRDFHGGGLHLPDPLAPYQGWYGTLGCTRGQNADVQMMYDHIEDFFSNNPNAWIRYVRFR